MFEYKVDYYVKAFGQQNGNEFNTSTLYTSLWQRYNTSFNGNIGVSYYRENVIHWGTAHVNHSSETESCNSYSKNIT